MRKYVFSSGDMCVNCVQADDKSTNCMQKCVGHLSYLILFVLFFLYLVHCLPVILIFLLLSLFLLCTPGARCCWQGQTKSFVFSVQYWQMSLYRYHW